MKNWLYSWFVKKECTYTEFINYLHCNEKTITDRKDFFYTYCHLFITEFQKPEHKEDLYFISDLLVM
jgi:hypothetical protein